MSEIDDLDDNVDELRRWPQDEWPFREGHTPDIDWAIFDPLGLGMFLCVQASFREFASVAEYERHRIVPTFDAIGIKAFFSVDAMHGEHIFLDNVSTDGITITATLQADGMRRKDLKEGKEVRFPIARLSDWFLVRNGRGIGGFTVSHVWNEFTAKQQKSYRNQAPFVWYQHRGNKSAIEELADLPKCKTCKKRCLDFEYDKGPTSTCGICQSGSRRCNCTRCGAPLIRNEKLPELCFRCGRTPKIQTKK